MEGVAMQATKSWAGALASALLVVSSASAQYYSPATGQYYSPVLRTPLGYAPDATGPGYYLYLPNGQTLGPNYHLRPCFEPYNGVRPQVHRVQGADGRCTVAPGPAPQPGAMQPEGQYPYHPYARSPRDFFMFRDSLEEQLGRQERPNLLP
jgi:hypothetical protein